MTDLFVMLKKIITNDNFQKSSWLLAEKIGKIFFSFLIGILVARYLSPDKYGLFNYAQAYIAIFLAMSSLGMDSVVIRELVKEPKKESEILGTAIYLKFVAGFISLLITNIFAFYFIDEEELKLIIYVLSFIYLVHPFIILDCYYQSKAITRIPVISKLIGMATIGFFNIILIYSLNGTLVHFAILVSLELTIINLIMAYNYFSEVKKFQLFRSFNLNRMKQLLVDSWPLILSGLSIMLYMKIDQIMIGSLAGNRELGIYSAAVRLAEIWYFIPGVIIGPLIPKLINSYEINNKKFESNLHLLISIMIWLGIAVAIFNSVLADILILTLYGNEYIASQQIFLIYIWIGIFVNIGIMKSLYLNIKNLPKIQLIVSVLGCIINIFLNLILIPAYGGIGAAVASLISYWVQAHGSLFLFRDTRKFAFEVIFDVIRLPKKIFNRG